MLIGVCFFNHQNKHWSTNRSLFVGLMLAVSSLICFAAAKPEIGLPWHFFLGSYGTALVCFLLAYAFQRRLPRLAVLDWLANISYPVYIIHGVAGYVLLTVLVGLEVHPYLAIALTILMSLGCAHVLHHTVEKPSIRWARWWLHQEAKRIPEPAPEAQSTRAA
jgi:peptidoglycan/LPS O-acetylase OafA/YrhL